MNETPTIAPLPISVLTVPQTVAPLENTPPLAAGRPVVDATPDTVPVRGRVASPRTVLIRAMLDDTDGGLTYSTALPLLAAAGFEVDQNTFNVTKSAWKRAKHPEAVNHPTNKVEAPKTRNVKAPKAPKAPKAVKTIKVDLPEVSVADAIAFVQDNGGLAKAEANVLRGRACLKAFKLLVKQTSKLAA